MRREYVPMWDTDDLAAFLKVPAKTLREWRHKGTGPEYVRVGKHVRYDPRKVTAWLAQGGTAAAAA
ncbi:helix-turn-helix transcriptional regulator [Actinokineospora sp. NPDC004072]